MEESLNIRVRQSVRKDLLQNGRVLFLPEGMTDAEIEEAYGDAVKKGLIKSIVKAPIGGGGGRGAGPAAGEGPADRVWSPAPSSAQVFVQSVGAGTPGNAVSAGNSGPCMVNHVSMFTYSDAGALNMPMRFAVHISKSKDVGPFAGDISIFESYDPQGLIGDVVGHGEVFYKQRVDTAVGSRVFPMAEFFPHILIPFRTFYVNCTAMNLNHPAACFITVDFGPVDVPKARLASTVSVEPRTVEQAPAVRPAAVGPHLETRTFFGYAEIKVAEALGFRPVWSTIHAVPGQAGYYTIQGVVK